MPELLFKGKEFVYNHHLSVPFRSIIPNPAKSIGDAALDGNLIIHGDNLHALKALLPMYAGKIDCIFIDPPYNTGNENWSYNDNVNSPMIKEWLSGNPVGIEDGLRHDKWCAMMWPRLRLLHELLSETGILAVAIDNNELVRLWLLLIEIFGEDGFAGCAPWLSEPSGGKEKTGLRTGHEYILVFAKRGAVISQDLIQLGDLSLTDEIGPYLKGRELRKWGGVSQREDRPGQWFPITAPDDTEVWPIRNDGEDGHWRWGPNNPEMRQIRENPNSAHWEMRPFDPGVTWHGQSERWVPYAKIRLSEKPVGWKTWLANLAYNSDGTRELKEIFGSKVFDTPKPTALTGWVISLVDDDEALVLDSFAGSATTAHAVLAANARDGGNRKFVLVECEDYADTLTAERVRRVINGYAFTGTQREELLREKITFTKLRQAGTLLDRVQAIEDAEGSRFDRIAKTVDDGELIVTGEKRVEERTEGLGGSFTFCTLGPPIDLDALLTGDSLPDFESLASVLFHMATNQAFDAAALDCNALGLPGHGYLGEGPGHHVWLIYKPDLDFLKSADAALTLSKARDIAACKLGERHIVYAPSRFVSQKLLNDEGLLVEFAPLPFALYRLQGA
jgi:adenine-specific DNA-methyltransferase